MSAYKRSQGARARAAKRAAVVDPVLESRRREAHFRLIANIREVAKALRTRGVAEGHSEETVRLVVSVLELIDDALVDPTPEKRQRLREAAKVAREVLGEEAVALAARFR